ncbi:hypothetical protein JCM10207_000940 [Rhodosporidiobolus poonsookiae]
MLIPLPHLDSSDLALSRVKSAPPPLPSPYLFGTELCRVRTRTSSISSETTSPPSDLLSSPASSDSPYILGPPLSRIRTRNDDFASLSRPTSPTSALYQDRFVRLTSSHLILSHLLFRRTIAFPLSRIRSCRPFLTPSQRIKLIASGRLPTSISTGGLVGWTGLTWARDPSRLVYAKEGKLVVVDVGGWVGSVGFSVEDAEAWWAAWEEAEKMVPEKARRRKGST